MTSKKITFYERVRNEYKRPVNGTILEKGVAICRQCSNKNAYCIIDIDSGLPIVCEPFITKIQALEIFEEKRKYYENVKKSERYLEDVEELKRLEVRDV